MTHERENDSPRGGIPSPEDGSALARFLDGGGTSERMLEMLVNDHIHRSRRPSSDSPPAQEQPARRARATNRNPADNTPVNDELGKLTDGQLKTHLGVLARSMPDDSKLVAISSNAGAVVHTLDRYWKRCSPVDEFPKQNMIWYHDWIRQAMGSALFTYLPQARRALAEALSEKEVTPRSTSTVSTKNMAWPDSAEQLAHYCHGAIDQITLQRAASITTDLTDALREAQRREILDPSRAHVAWQMFSQTKKCFTDSQKHARSIDRTLLTKYGIGSTPAVQLKTQKEEKPTANSDKKFSLTRLARKIRRK